MKVCTNLILSCHHILYGIEYDKKYHQVGAEYWCPTDGLVGITEVESTYEIQDAEPASSKETDYLTCEVNNNV